MNVKAPLFAFALVFSAIPALSQTPEILDVSDVVAGAQRTETRYLYAMGKWSDAGDDVAVMSTEIHCYKRFGLCEVASASTNFNRATVGLDTYDVLRWDDRELIAVDSSPICAVNTLRVDFTAKKVSTSSTSKGETKDKLCVAAEPSFGKTAFLLGTKDELARIKSEADKKKK